MEDQVHSWEWDTEKSGRNWSFYLPWFWSGLSAGLPLPTGGCYRVSESEVKSLSQVRPHGM